MSDWEKQKRVIMPYLQRADEIEKLDPKVAYYCRLYAVDQGINLDNRHKDADDLLSVVLTQLESAKPAIELDQDDDKKHCEQFALNVFRKAQRKDESGIADRDTAKAYYAAFNFLEVLKQFGGNLSEDNEKLRRFAVFRASEIKKALDEGLKPPALKPYEDQSNSSDIIDPSPYDPGYQVGLKILCSEDGMSPGRPGTITGIPDTPDGLFSVEMDDGKFFQISAQFLAPDLPVDSRVTFFSADGVQVDAEVSDMDKSFWPPTYALSAVGDGRVQLCTHDSFALVHVPLQPLKSASGQWPRRISPQGSMEDIVPQGATGPSDNSSPGIQHIRGDSHGQLQGEPGVTNGFAGGLTSIGSVSSEQILCDNTSHPMQPKIAEVDEEPTAIRVDTNLQPLGRKPGYEPDLQAVEDAKRCSKFANTSLNFSDVDNAINYLNDALKLLTGYGDNEIVVRVANH